MKFRFALILGGLLLSKALLWAQATTFTYQGRLVQDTNLANGPYQMRFTVHDSPTNGLIVGGPLTLNPVSVSNGLFTAELDFGLAPFTGKDRWLEIEVGPEDAESLTTLEPRYRIGAAPYAIHALSAGGLVGIADPTLDIEVNGTRGMRLQRPPLPSDAVCVIGGWYGNTIGTDVRGATIAGGGWGDILGLGYGNNIDADFGTISGGAANTMEDLAWYATIGGGWVNTIELQASYATISGGRENTIEGYAQCPTISGGVGNRIGSYAFAALIDGGLFNAIGWSSFYAVVGGGAYNIIESNTTASVVSGGFDNVISTRADYATIGGGQGNRIPTHGDYATIPGGQDNCATNYAFAAGRRAKALHLGAFVWADSVNDDLVSTNEDSMTLRAAGGYRLFSDADMSTGVYLEPGGGSWANLSDRAAKTNFVEVSASEVLDKVAAMPVKTWNYKAQDSAVRHMGPTAQDFRAAFGLGSSDKQISTVDADGVALAAIQGLNQKFDKAIAAKDAEIKALKDSVAELKALMNRLIEAKADPSR